MRLTKSSLRIITGILLSLSFSMTLKSAEINLTPEEKAWIKQHPIIRVANETDWPPFDFNEANVPKGFVIDYIKTVTAKAGIKLNFIHGFTWTELVDLFKQRKIDVMPVFYHNEEREKYTLYTGSYYRGKLGIFAVQGVETSNLLSKRVGMETSHGSIPIVKKRHKGIRIIEIDSKVELVRKLATKQLDAIIGNPFLFYHIARESQITNIELSTYIELSRSEQKATSFHIGVRKDWPILHSILQKAMAHVTEEEMNQIQNRWTDISIVKPVNWVLIGQIAGAIALIIIILIWNNRILRLMVKRKTAELKLLNESLELKVKERTHELNVANADLQQTIDEIKTLKGLLPICAHCKKIRDDSGYWNQIELYVEKHSDAQFSHGICEECAETLYSDSKWYKKRHLKKK